MSHHDEHAGERPPTPIHPDAPGGPWYRTLDEAIHAWAIEKKLHGPQEVPSIRVYLHSHVGGWNVG
jgi:hypothetical protein